MQAIQSAGNLFGETFEEKSGRGYLNLTVFPILLGALPSTQKRFYEKTHIRNNETGFVAANGGSP